MVRFQRYISLILITGMLCSGATNILTKKGQNDVVTIDASGGMAPFNHPWVQTLIMFTGETLCLVFIGCQFIRFNYYKSKHDDETTEAGKKLFGEEGKGGVSENDNVSSIHKPKFEFSFIFLLPMLCDLAGTTFGGIGLLYTAASVWQMLRGSIIIFSGILSKIFLKRKLGVHQWIGMCVVALALAMVGSSSLLGNPADSKNTTLGILFILLGQFCNSVQMVVEETFLKHRHYTPLNVVGMEGIFGMFVMLFFVLPALYFVPVTNENFHDDLWDALVQISNSSSLLALVLVYLFSISVYNFCGLSIAKKMTTVHRTLVDASTTVLIWLVELIAFYAGATEFGEGWNVWSWMEVGGFAILFLGNCIYNGVLRLPYLRYPQPKTGLVVFDSENEVSDFERGDDGHLGLGGDEDEDEDVKVQFTAEKVLN